MTRFFLAIAVLTSANAAQAGFLTTSPTPPVIGPSDVAQPLFAGPGVFDPARDFTNNPTPGQSFTTPNAAPAYLLNSITLKGTGVGAAGAGTFFGGNWNLRISAISGTTLTPIATDSAIANVLPNDNDFQYYVTFGLTTPVSLLPDAQYAFDLFSDTGYFGFSRVTSIGDGDVYAGGAAFNTTGVRNFTGTTADFTVGGDRTFYASLSPDVAAVPVPPTIALALVGLLPLWRAGRRRRA